MSWTTPLVGVMGKLMCRRRQRSPIFRSSFTPSKLSARSPLHASQLTSEPPPSAVPPALASYRSHPHHRFRALSLALLASLSSSPVSPSLTGLPSQLSDPSFRAEPPPTPSLESELPLTPARVALHLSRPHRRSRAQSQSLKLLAFPGSSSVSPSPVIPPSQLSDPSPLAYPS